MKIAQAFDGEFCVSDFTEEELAELMGLARECLTPEELRERYFAFHDDVKDRVLDKHKWSD